jgi:hypothetical protein
MSRTNGHALQVMMIKRGMSSKLDERKKSQSNVHGWTRPC